ncbi:MAG: hypothetical protein PSX80_09955 [bacterium]|nr:hypothetical protein [bacterium]
MSSLAPTPVPTLANMELFNRLGDEIELQWRDANYDELQLPAIARSQLAEHDLPSKLTPWDVLEWAMAMPELPPQADPNSNFGDPPITVYSGSRFHIDVYFWFTGTTAIHQHAFSGAFQVLAGSSIHSWYEFLADDYVNVFMEYGRMELKLCEILEVGAVQEINAGRGYIHSLFHLDDPSVTIVVRTRKSPMFLPQYSYHKPHLALDPFYVQDSMTKKVQSVVAMLKAKRPDADAKIGELLANSDIQQTFHLLQNLRSMLRSDKVKQMFNVENFDQRFDALFSISKARHGARAERLLDVFEFQDKLVSIVNRRDYVTDPALRFFLAVLLNVTGRENIYNLIKQRYPDADPQDKVLDWTFDLANTRVMGVDPPNALGIEGFGDIDIVIFEDILNGKDAAAISDSLKQQGAGIDDLDARIGRIRNSLLLSTLI